MLLRLVVWNCHMRLHDKVAMLRELRPDVAVIPECACPEVLLRRASGLETSDLAWDGGRPDRGIAILAFGPWRLEPDLAHRPRAGSTLPVRVQGPASLRLAGVWAIPPWAHGRHGRPPEPLAEGLERLRDFLGQPPAVLAGDFNHTLVSRRADGRLARTPLARRIADLGFVSAYHHDRAAVDGHEAEATFYRLGRFPSAHHLDHVFLDRATARGLRRVELIHGARWDPLESTCRHASLSIL